MPEPDARLAAELWEASAATWTAHVRAGYDVYRDSLNTPAFLALLPPVGGLRGLDVGCGEGENTRHLARRGARMTALDVAPTFVAAARERERSEPLGIDYRLGDAVALPFPERSFDFVTAFMSLMDVPDFPRALREVRRVLRERGFVQFSILHPCFTMRHRRVLRDEAGVAYAVELAGYFDPPDGIERWRFGSAPPAVKASSPEFAFVRLHATLAQWLNALVDAGLQLEHVGEPQASVEQAAAVPYVADTRVVPLSLIVRARRPQG